MDRWRLPSLWCLLIVFVLAPRVTAAQEEVRFTVTADMRHEHEAFARVLWAINGIGGPGGFHVSVGDEDDRVWENRALIDTFFGSTAVWFPIIGNHEAEDPVEMDWLREEFATGNGERVPLSAHITGSGPAGTEATTYSWNRGRAHFIAINEYWNGTDVPGGDVGIDGDVIPELLAWLEADLKANTRPAVFVFGHEPAFPFHRHLDDSLNKYEGHRDAFWALLERESVVAYICGHTHVFSIYQHADGRVWQIDVGNAGRDSDFLDGQTFLNVAIEGNSVRFEVCRNHDGPFTCGTGWTEKVPILFKDGFESGVTDRWSCESIDR